MIGAQPVVSLLVGACALGALGAGGSATIASPPASADSNQQCAPDALAMTAAYSTGSARQYLASHPQTDNAVTAAQNQPRADGSATLRGYFSNHPQEYRDLRDILAPTGDAQRQCNVTLLPPKLAAAYDESMTS